MQEKLTECPTTLTKLSKCDIMGVTLPPKGGESVASHPCFMFGATVTVTSQKCHTWAFYDKSDCHTLGSKKKVSHLVKSG